MLGLLSSAEYVQNQMHSYVITFTMEANTMNPEYRTSVKGAKKKTKFLITQP